MAGKPIELTQKGLKPTQAEIEKILADANIPEEKKQKLEDIFSLFISESSFSGPLPHPEILKGYNEAVPGAAERIIKMAEKRLDHKIQLENNGFQLGDFAIKEQFRQSKRGQSFAFVVALFGLGLAGLLAYLDSEIVAGILASTTILGLVAVFANGKKEQEKQNKINEEKNDE